MDHDNINNNSNVFFVVIFSVNENLKYDLSQFFLCLPHYLTTSVSTCFQDRDKVQLLKNIDKPFLKVLLL